MTNRECATNEIGPFRAFVSACGLGLGLGAGAMLVAQGHSNPRPPHADPQATHRAAPAPAAQPSRDVALRTLTARSVRITDDDGNVVLELSGDELGGLVQSRRPDGTPLDQFPPLSVRGTKPPEPEVIITPAPGAPAPGSPTKPPNNPDSGGSPTVPGSSPPLPRPWEIPENWGNLYQYMSKSAAHQIMGEPDSIQKTSSGERWYYGTGHLLFDTGNRLTSWRQPRPD